MSSTVANDLGKAPPSERSPSIYIHPSAVVSPTAVIGEDTRVWCFCQVRERAVIGSECTLSKGVYVDFEVHIGNRVKIQNHVSVYHGVTIEDGAFIGPHVCFTNDRVPRAITPSGRVKGAEDWDVTPIVVRYGASIGAHSVILPGVTIGRFAMVASGSVVTRDVPDHALVVGNPARLRGYVCACGKRATEDSVRAGTFECGSWEEEA